MPATAKFCPKCGSTATGLKARIFKGKTGKQAEKNARLNAYSSIVIGVGALLLSVFAKFVFPEKFFAIGLTTSIVICVLSLVSGGRYFWNKRRGKEPENPEATRHTISQRIIYGLANLIVAGIFWSITSSTFQAVEQNPEYRTVLPFLYFLTLVFSIMGILIAVGLARRGVAKRTFLMIVGFSVYVYFFNTQLLVLFDLNVKDKILIGAEFHQGDQPDPVDFEFIGPAGQKYTVPIYPGQFNVFVDPQMGETEVLSMFEPYGGRTLGKIPSIGYYFVGVRPEDTLRAFVELSDDARIVGGGPNFVLETASDAVDLRDVGRKTEDLVAAFLKSPEPGADVILAIIDGFNKENNEPVSHGEEVYQAAVMMMGDRPAQRIEVFDQPCAKKASMSCTSIDSIVNSLVATVAGAQINGQRVVINLSIGVQPETKNKAVISTNRRNGANEWGALSWLMYQSNIFQALNTLIEQDQTGWVEKNVSIVQAAGNGVAYVKSEDEKKAYGMDVSKAIEFLGQKYPNLRNRIMFAGVADENGRPASYSNFGTDVVMKQLPSDSSRGTSFASPQFAGEIVSYWDQHKDLSNADVSTDVRGLPREVFESQEDVKVQSEEPKPVVRPTVPPPTEQGILCNGKRWTPCAEGETFYCPPGGGDASCNPKGYKLCNGVWWAPCDESKYVWTCTTSGAECWPKEDPPVYAPSPEPKPVVPEHRPCFSHGDCSTYGYHNCTGGGAQCSSAGTCHCTLTGEFGTWAKCPCPAGYMCLGMYCVLETGGWPNE